MSTLRSAIDIAPLGDLADPAAIFGLTETGVRATPAACAAQGVTLWLERSSPMRGPVDELMAVVEAGPPR